MRSVPNGMSDQNVSLYGCTCHETQTHVTSPHPCDVNYDQVAVEAISYMQKICMRSEMSRFMTKTAAACLDLMRE